MVGDMENLKIKVNDEAESKEVQELLSYLDYNGKPYLLTNKKMREDGCRNDYEIGFLFAERGGNVSCSHKTDTKYFDDHPYKEITLQKLKDLVVLKRNSIDDATHYYGGSKYYLSDSEFYQYSENKWVNIDEYVDGMTFKKIEKDGGMKEYIAKVSGDWRFVESNELVSGRIEVPEGAEIFLLDESCGKDILYFVKHDGEVFHEYYINATDVPNNTWIKGIIKELHKDMGEVLWQRNHHTTPNNSIQYKLKFIEKWLNGEKIQYILGVESEKTQWHNFTEGAMQYIKRSDIKFREAPKYVTINGIEFKSVESLLKHVKNNFDLEDGDNE